MALLAVPWTIKPVFGLLSDFVPLLGSRRRNYLLLANGLAAASLILLAFIPLAPGSRWLLFALLLPTTMAIALGDVIVDALMVEKGQPLGLTGRFQSIQWTAANTALLLTGESSSEAMSQRRSSNRSPLLSAGRCGSSLSPWHGATPATMKTPISMRQACTKPEPRYSAYCEIRCSSRSARC